jgi:hypothetical protein
MIEVYVKDGDREIAYVPKSEYDTLLDIISEYKKGKGGLAEWVGVNPFTDSVMCSNCEYCIPNIELVTRYCPDCGYEMSVNKELNKLYGLED